MRISVFVAIIFAFISNEVDAAHFRDGGFLAHQGVLETMRIEPRLPAPGEGFTIKLSGSWPPVNPYTECRPPLEISSVEVFPSGLIAIYSNTAQDPDYCDQPPANWDLEATIPASASDNVDENGFLTIEHTLYSGINTFTHISQVFDMRLGTHEVPAFIGSGFWISDDLPNEGILVEQQGNRTLFYSLGYDRDPSLNDEGEPVWQLVAGEMYGNSTLGRSYRFDWPFDENHMPLESPSEDELITSNDSGAIIADDYNNIRVFTEVSGILGVYHSYQRILFGLDKSRLPNYVPPLAGRWNLYGFEGRDAAFTASVEFQQGHTVAPNQYRFNSVNDDWIATCTVSARGSGDCLVEHANDNSKFEFPITAFQGNLARGNLSDGNNNPLDGVLVRSPYQLPVLENQ